MAVTVGTDTYITQADATTYISDYHVNDYVGGSSDASVSNWEDLTSDNKDVYLRKATKILQSIPVVGIKATEAQTLEFPRAIWRENAFYTSTRSNFFPNDNWYVQTSVPDDIKYAQAEIALDLMGGVSERARMQREGVKSFSLGKLSENYGSGKPNTLPYEAKELLKPYMLGGARIA